MKLESSEKPEIVDDKQTNQGNQGSKPWQIIAGIVLAAGLFWLFIPKGGDSEYTPFEISGNEKIISEYQFGKITIAGKKYYDSDIAIFPDRVKHNWNAMKDHELLPGEVEDVANANIKTVVIGTGSYGHVIVNSKTIELFESKGIKTHVMDTYKAVRFYNELPRENLAGIFHLTE